ncbi:MAG: DUF1998 domain-containing protein [Desulfobacterales bacterium]
MGGIHAVEHAAIGIFPLLVIADRNDLGGISTPLHPQVGSAAIFIYDGVPGGAGLSRQAYKRAKDLLENTYDVIRSCPCESGCPSCVHSPKCGSGNRPIDKDAAIFILNNIIFPRHSKMTKRRRSHQPFPKESVFPSEKIIPLQEKETEANRDKRSISRRRLLRKRMSARRKGLNIKCNSLPELKGPDRESILRFCIFDIETQRSAQEVGGWHRADLMGISCAVLYDSKNDRYFEFLDDQVNELIEHLKACDLVVGFNVKRFDFRVLGGYSDFNFQSLHTLDILEEIHNRLGYRLSLDHLARVTLGKEKTADGLQALQWWQQGRIREIIDYCKKDVEITRELFLYGQKNGYLLFMNKAKKTVRIPVKW